MSYRVINCLAHSILSYRKLQLSCGVQFVLPSFTFCLTQGKMSYRVFEAYKESFGQRYFVKSKYIRQSKLQKSLTEESFGRIQLQKKIHRVLLFFFSLCKRKNRSSESINTDHFLYLRIISIIEMSVL